VEILGQAQNDGRNDHPVPAPCASVSWGLINRVSVLAYNNNNNSL